MTQKVTINITKIITEAGQDNAYQVIKDMVEPVLIKELLHENKGNKTKAARVAGFSKPTLQRKMKRHGITVDLVVND